MEKALGIYKCVENFYLNRTEKKRVVISETSLMKVDQCNFQVLGATKI